MEKYNQTSTIGLLLLFPNPMKKKRTRIFKKKKRKMGKVGVRSRIPCLHLANVHNAIIHSQFSLFYFPSFVCLRSANEFSYNFFPFQKYTYVLLYTSVRNKYACSSSVAIDDNKCSPRNSLIMMNQSRWTVFWIRIADLEF